MPIFSNILWHFCGGVKVLMASVCGSELWSVIVGSSILTFVHVSSSSCLLNSSDTLACKWSIWPCFTPLLPSFYHTATVSLPSFTFSLFILCHVYFLLPYCWTDTHNDKELIKNFWANHLLTLGSFSHCIVSLVMIDWNGHGLVQQGSLNLKMFHITNFLSLFQSLSLYIC